MRNCSWYFLLIVSFMISCAQKQPSADAIIAKSIEAHGGMENYQQLKHLDLLKDIKRYDSTEALTLHRIERQHFSFVAPRQSSIQFKEGEDTILMKKRKRSLSESIMTLSFMIRKSYPQQKALLMALDLCSSNLFCSRMVWPARPMQECLH